MRSLRCRGLGWVFILALVVLAACGPQTTPTATLSPTDTPAPTDTPTTVPVALLPTRILPTDGPTPTLLPTETPIASETPIPSDTPTLTDTAVPTDTVQPPTATDTLVPTEVISSGGELNVSLSWNTTGNVDLGAQEPDGTVISAFSPVSSTSGGVFADDANNSCAGAVNDPAEFVTWDAENALAGQYTVFARYQTACGNIGQVDVELIITLGEEEMISEVASLTLGEQFEIAFNFDPVTGSITPVDEVVVESTPVPSTTGVLAYGSRISDTISDEQFAVFYNFLGMSGDNVVIDLVQVNGNLDPYLILRDSQGTEIGNDDDGGEGINARLAFELPSTDTYTIVATRFQEENGNSSGAFELTLTLQETAGTTSTGPLTLTYGSSITETISAEQFEHRITFSGSRGDVVTISMAQRSGDLDSYLSLLDSSGNEVASNDDIDSSTRDARISNLRLAASGAFTIVATRFQGVNGNTSGDFELTLEQAESSE